MRARDDDADVSPRITAEGAPSIASTRPSSFAGSLDFFPLMEPFLRASVSLASKYLPVKAHFARQPFFFPLAKLPTLYGAAPLPDSRLVLRTGALRPPVRVCGRLA